MRSTSACGLPAGNALTQCPEASSRPNGTASVSVCRAQMTARPDQTRSDLVTMQRGNASRYPSSFVFETNQRKAVFVLPLFQSRSNFLLLAKMRMWTWRPSLSLLPWFRPFKRLACHVAVGLLDGWLLVFWGRFCGQEQGDDGLHLACRTPTPRKKRIGEVCRVCIPINSSEQDSPEKQNPLGGSHRHQQDQETTSSLASYLSVIDVQK